jgi:nicotinamidase-related amidase
MGITDTSTLSKLRRTGLALLLLAPLVCAGCTASLTAIDRSERPGRALLLIDMQRGVLSPDGPATLGEQRAESLLRTTERAVDTALEQGMPIALVKNEWSGWRFVENWWFDGAFRKGSDWAQVDPRLLSRIPAEKQVIFSKSFPSAFSDPNLQGWLEENRVGELVIGGLYGDQCVTATARDALDHGYAVRLVAGGIATRDEADLAPAMGKLVARGATLWSPGAEGKHLPGE